MSKIMKVFSVLTWIGGLILGIAGGILGAGLYSDFSLAIAFGCWCAAFISGAILYSIGELLENQEKMMGEIQDLKKSLSREISFAETKRKDEEALIQKENERVKAEEARVKEEEAKQEKARKDAYWEEHAEEKAALESERQALADELTAILDSLNNHPGDRRRLELQAQISALREEESLGKLKKAERLSLEQKIRALREEIYRVTTETDLEKAEIRKNIQPKRERLAEIDKILPADNTSSNTQKKTWWMK